MQNKPYTWKLKEEEYDIIKRLLLDKYNGVEEQTTNQYELWRIRIDKVLFILYNSGKLTLNKPNEVEVIEIKEMIDKIVDSKFKSTNKSILLGFDETGKGEVLGHIILAGVKFPSSLKEEIEDIVGAADTKNKRSLQYWDQLYQSIDNLKPSGLDFITERIPPSHADKFNLNKIMDVVYQRIISALVRNVTDIKSCSIVIDDYGIGNNLEMFLHSLDKMGSVIIVEEKADDNYLEAKLASIIAKRERERLMNNIAKKYGDIGSGNAGDLVTKKWLEEWKKSGKPWPWFVKQSFKTVRELDGKKEPIKEDPPIRHTLLSKDSLDAFNQGRLSVSSLSIVCPYCNNIARSIILATKQQQLGYEIRCIKCKHIIDDINTTLLYYNGYILPDSNAIIEHIISNDLGNSKLFENFTFLLHPKVREECDKGRGKRELEAIADYASIGVIELKELDVDIDDTKTNDELIVNAAKDSNAILLGRDKTVYAHALSKGIFVIK